MPSIREQLLHFMNGYLEAKTQAFKGHELGKLMRREIPTNLFNKTELSKDKYVIKGSVGQANWAYVPWLAIMNREITTSTQRGFYLVYVFAEDMSHVYLCLAQGVTETPIKEMARINKEIRERIDTTDLKIQKNNDFNLGESKYAREYRSSAALHIAYSVNDLPSEDQLLNDFQKMLNYYEDYIISTNRRLLPDVFARYLSVFISQKVAEENVSEVFGEVKLVLADLLENNKGMQPEITYNSKIILKNLPFIEHKEDTYELFQFTPLDLPSTSYNNILIALGEFLQGKSKDEKISNRTIHSLKQLDYIAEDETLKINYFPELFEQGNRVVNLKVIKLVLNLLVTTSTWAVQDKGNLIKEVFRHLMVNSTEGIPIEEGVLNKGYSYITTWLKELNIIDKELRLIESKLIESYQLKKQTRETVNENAIQPNNRAELVNHIHQYIQSRGFYYTEEEVKNLYLSIRAKPFIILSGISGTGKTKMVQWFAESVGATERNGQFTLIPIRPDWNDGSDLLGYVDIKGDFKEGLLTKVIKAATTQPERPYFVLLDEMNLARVEHYFSDILSVMESRKWQEEEVVSSYLLTKETAGFNLRLPNNLYIIGTVNMDETTYPFSKKILDRANTIEFNVVDLANFAFLEETDNLLPLSVSNEYFVSRFLHLKDAYGAHSDLIKRVTDELIRINQVLEKNKSHVGYRVRDEICFYMVNNDTDQLLDYNRAFDHCILQKILPRIAGSDSSVDQLLRELYEIFTGKKFDEDVYVVNDGLEDAKYPQSAAKVIEMHRRLQDGYTSFWIS